MDIAELDLSCRTYACLKSAKIDTIEQLAKLSFEDLARCKNMTTKGIEEIREKMAKRPITLGELIRQSNEHLAGWVTAFVKDVIRGIDSELVLAPDFQTKLLADLNRPATEVAEGAKNETD